MQEEKKIFKKKQPVERKCYIPKKNDYSKKKYRKSIVEGMQEEKIKKYGFEVSYIIFERSINKMAKEGDIAEERALEYLKSNDLLGENYRLNKVIALKTIKIEADIIDYDNKIIYEVKSRKNGKLSKQACINKYKVFKYDCMNSNYEDFKFKGIVVANYEAGQKVKGIIDLTDREFDMETTNASFQKFYEKLEYYKTIEKS